MTGESTDTSTVTTEPSNDAAETAQEQVTIESLKADIDKVISINKELIASRDAAKVKVRSAETELEQAKEQREGIEGEIDALEQKFNTQLTDVLIDAAFEKELTLAGARNVEVAKKLLNKQDIKVENGKVNITLIQDSINSLKESDSYMFTSEEEEKASTLKTATPVARAGEPENENIVNKELKAAKSIPDLIAIIDKHNIKQ